MRLQWGKLKGKLRYKEQRAKELSRAGINSIVRAHVEVPKSVPRIPKVLSKEEILKRYALVRRNKEPASEKPSKIGL